MSGVEVAVEGLSKSFGRANIWADVTLTLPPGEISVLLGPSGTGKSVFLKCLIGLLKPERGKIVIHETDLVRTSERKLYEIRKLFGVLFQDGALFGSMNLYDNVAFPLREHTKKSESEIRDIVTEKMTMVGLGGDEGKLPGEISGGMRKRAGLARALVLDPEIILFDEPDSGLDPVRTAYLNQLIVDLNAQTDSTFLIVTHDINTAQTLPDNMGIMYHRHLAMFGPRELLLTSEDPVVSQFLNGRREGPIGMSEEKDTDEQAAEREAQPALPPLQPQLKPLNGVERKAAARRLERVMGTLHTLPDRAQQAITESLTDEELRRYGVNGSGRERVQGGSPVAMPVGDEQRRPSEQGAAGVEEAAGVEVAAGQTQQHRPSPVPRSATGDEPAVATLSNSGWQLPTEREGPDEGTGKARRTSRWPLRRERS